MIKYYSYFPKVDSLQVHLKFWVESRNISHGFWCRLRCIELCLKAWKSNILISTNQRPMRLLLSGHLTCRPRSSRPSAGTPPRQRDCPRICSSPGWSCWSGRSPSRVARGSPTGRSRRPTAPAYTCRQPEFCSLLAFTPTMAFYLPWDMPLSQVCQPIKAQYPEVSRPMREQKSVAACSGRWGTLRRSSSVRWWGEAAPPGLQVSAPGSQRSANISPRHTEPRTDHQISVINISDCNEMIGL